MTRTPRQLLTSVWNRFTLKAKCGPIGIGLVGIGGWGASNAISIMRSRRFTIAGVYDVEESESRRFASRYKTRNFESLEALLGSPAIQAVCITVPNHLHDDVVRAAADAGKDVFIEKPLASTAEVCRDLGDYCRNKGVHLQVGHQMRREPAFRVMKRRIDDGELGAPLYAQGVYTLARRNRNDWRGDASRCPGGSMEQLGIHLIDVLEYLFGTPAAGRGWARNLTRGEAGPDWAQVTMVFENQVYATVASSFSAPKHLALTVFCENGTISSDGVYLLVAREGARAQRERPSGISGAVAQFIAFADAIASGELPETGATEAFAVINVIQSLHGPGPTQGNESASGVPC